MRRIFELNSVLVFSIIVLSGCGAGKTKDKNQNKPDQDTTPDVVEKYSGQPASRPDVTFSSTVRQEEKDQIARDFSFLTTVNITDESGRALRSTIGISDTKPQSLVNWLNDRLQYIVPEKYDLKSAVQYSSTVTDITELFEDGSLSAVKTVTTASNVGAAVYMAGKQVGLMAKMSIPGVGMVPVNSPRVGVMQIGEGLFQDRAGSGSLDSTANILSRLATLIHEARHSDGNSKNSSLAFAHRRCPYGHDYERVYACDNNQNGPYTVGGDFITAFKNSCSGCSPKTISILKAMAADSYSRVLSTSVWDDSPEGTR